VIPGDFASRCWPQARRASRRDRNQSDQARHGSRRVDARPATGSQAGADADAGTDGRADPQPTAEPSCHTSYEGACLDPNSSDDDCEGGSGGGPDYTGTVRVVGDDPYDLDRDGDGIARDP